MWLDLPPALRPVQCVQPLPADDGDEGVHDAAVKLLPGAAVQLLERLLKRDDALVGAVGGHRVEGVANEDDTGAEWYVIGCEAVGVAAAIVVLVVVGDYRRRGRQVGKATRYPGADLRVRLDHRPLLFAEAAGLLQHIVRHGELAHVVEESGLLNKLLLPHAQSHLRGDLGGVPGGAGERAGGGPRLPPQRRAQPADGVRCPARPPPAVGAYHLAPVAHPVAAHSLCPVHGRLGAIDELPGGLRRRRVHRDAEAGGYLTHGCEDAAGRVFTKPLRQDHRGRGLRGRQHADQLVAAQVRHLLHAVTHAGREGAQHRVALDRPQAVVDHPEPIETGNDNAELGAVLRGQRTGALDLLQDRDQRGPRVPAVVLQPRAPYCPYFRPNTNAIHLFSSQRRTAKPVRPRHAAQPAEAFAQA